MVIAVGCTVFQTWRGDVPWALQVKVLHSYVRQRQWGTRRSRTSLDGALACALGGPRDTWMSRTPRGGRSGTPAGSAEHPSLGDTWRRRIPPEQGTGPGLLVW